MRQKYLHQHLLSSLALSRRLFSVAAALLLILPAIAHAAVAEPTRTTLSATASGEGADLIATVKTATGSLVTSGTVDFLLPSGQSLGSAIVGGDGTATLAMAKLPQGTSTGVTGSSEVDVEANYHASAAAGSFADSVSPQVATPAATTATPDFSVTGSPTTVTVAQGAYGTTAITVASLDGYAGSMELSCTNLPAQVTCAFSPTQQNLTANGSFTASLQLQTQAASGQNASIVKHSPLALALLFPGGLLLLGFARRLRQIRGLQVLGVVLLLAGTALGLSGCSQRYGYLKHPPPVATGTPAGTYTITVAVDGNVGSSVSEHDVTVSLVVQ